MRAANCKLGRSSVDFVPGFTHQRCSAATMPLCALRFIGLLEHHLSRLLEKRPTLISALHSRPELFYSPRPYCCAPTQTDVDNNLHTQVMHTSPFASAHLRLHGNFQLLANRSRCTTHREQKHATAWRWKLKLHFKLIGHSKCFLYTIFKIKSA